MFIGPRAGVLTVGMVGYPNVGKSSTINVLCGEKKVTVSMTPGKTKHLQVFLCYNLIPLFMSALCSLFCAQFLSTDIDMSIQ